MKASDVRTKTSDELATELGNLKKEQFNLRFQRATGQLENTSRVRVIRRDIARMKTVATQKRAGAEPVVKTTTAKPAVKTNKTPKSARRKAATKAAPASAKRALANKPNKTKK